MQDHQQVSAGVQTSARQAADTGCCTKGFQVCREGSPQPQGPGCCLDWAGHLWWGAACGFTPVAEHLEFFFFFFTVCSEEEKAEFSALEYPASWSGQKRLWVK